MVNIARLWKQRSWKINGFLVVIALMGCFHKDYLLRVAKTENLDFGGKSIKQYD